MGSIKGFHEQHVAKRLLDREVRDVAFPLCEFSFPRDELSGHSVEADLVVVSGEVLAGQPNFVK